MATTFNPGGTSPTSVSRPLDRIFDDAQHTGEINLSGRKLKEYPKLASKYDLVDTNSTDLSKNRFSEIPNEVCEYRSTERLNCYHNVIKFIPEAVLQLQHLTHLCLSRNQLTVIPAFIKHLQALEVLLASHNKLVSLPEEIGELKKLMEIDVSCNEISHLPTQIGDLKSLRSLNVRRNLLIELPLEMSKLNLRKLNFSSNKISTIPTVFRKIETLEEIVLDNNPLTLPPAHVCIKGKKHIMKYLQIEAIKEEKKREMLNDAEMKRLVRKSLPPQNSISSDEYRIDNSPEKWKRHTVLSNDSGYSTTDSLEKCAWSPSEAAVNGEHDEMNTFKAGTAIRDHQHRQEVDLQRRTLDSRPPPINTAYTGSNVHALTPGIPPPSPRSPEMSPQSPLTPVTPRIPILSAHDSSPSFSDEFSRELNRQKVEYERKKKNAEQLRLQHEEEEKEQRRRAAQRIQDEQKAMLEKQRQETRLNEEKMREEAKKREEAQRLAEQEAKMREEERRREEDRRREEEKMREEARLAEEQRKLAEDAKRQVENNYGHYQTWQAPERYLPASLGYIPPNHHGNHISPYSSDSSSPSTPGHPVGSEMYKMRTPSNGYLGSPPVSPHDYPSSRGYTENSSLSPNYHHSPPGLSPEGKTGSGLPRSPDYPPRVPQHSPKGFAPSYTPPHGHGRLPDTYSMNYRKQSSESDNKEEKKSNTSQNRKFGSDSNPKNVPNVSAPGRVDTTQPSSRPAPSQGGGRTGNATTVGQSNKTSGASRAPQAKTTPSRGIPVLQRRSGSGINGNAPSPRSSTASPRSSTGSAGPSPASSTTSLHKAGEKTSTTARRTRTPVTSPSTTKPAPGGERAVPPPPPVRRTGITSGIARGPTTPVSSNSSPTSVKALCESIESQLKKSSYSPDVNFIHNECVSRSLGKNLEGHIICGLSESASDKAVVYNQKQELKSEIGEKTNVKLLAGKGNTFCQSSVEENRENDKSFNINGKALNNKDQVDHSLQEKGKSSVQKSAEKVASFVILEEKSEKKKIKSKTCNMSAPSKPKQSFAGKTETKVRKQSSSSHQESITQEATCTMPKVKSLSAEKTRKGLFPEKDQNNSSTSAGAVQSCAASEIPTQEAPAAVLGCDDSNQIPKKTPDSKKSSDSIKTKTCSEVSNEKHNKKGLSHTVVSQKSSVSVKTRNVSIKSSENVHNKEAPAETLSKEISNSVSSTHVVSSSVLVSRKTSASELESSHHSTSLSSSQAKVIQTSGSKTQKTSMTLAEGGQTNMVIGKKPSSLASKSNKSSSCVVQTELKEASPSEASSIKSKSLGCTQNKLSPEKLQRNFKANTAMHMSSLGSGKEKFTDKPNPNLEKTSTEQLSRCNSRTNTSSSQKGKINLEEKSDKQTLQSKPQKEKMSTENTQTNSKKTSVKQTSSSGLQTKKKLPSNLQTNSAKKTVNESSRSNLDIKTGSSKHGQTNFKEGIKEVPKSLSKVKLSSKTVQATSKTKVPTSSVNLLDSLDMSSSKTVQTTSSKVKSSDVSEFSSSSSASTNMQATSKKRVSTSANVTSLKESVIATSCVSSTNAVQASACVSSKNTVQAMSKKKVSLSTNVELSNTSKLSSTSAASITVSVSTPSNKNSHSTIVTKTCNKKGGSLVTMTSSLSLETKDNVTTPKSKSLKTTLLNTRNMESEKELISSSVEKRKNKSLNCEGKSASKPTQTMMKECFSKSKSKPENFKPIDSSKNSVGNSKTEFSLLHDYHSEQSDSALHDQVSCIQLEDLIAGKDNDVLHRTCSRSSIDSMSSTASVITVIEVKQKPCNMNSLKTSSDQFENNQCDLVLINKSFPDTIVNETKSKKISQRAVINQRNRNSKNGNFRTGVSKEQVSSVNMSNSQKLAKIKKSFPANKDSEIGCGQDSNANNSFTNQKCSYRNSSTIGHNHGTTDDENQQKSIRNSQPAGGKGRGDDSKLRQVQKDAVNSFIAKRTGSTPDDEKRTIPSANLRTNNFNSLSRRPVGGISSTMKVIDSYKDSDPSFTLRRQEEKQKEEAEQLNRLRITIEKRLKVTLPDNLPETLRDGVLLCQLANSIRARSVLSIHVPSPAVPKLTLAKCRKNVENFLEACRKIGVGKEQICTSQDILEENGLARVSITIAALIAVATNPKSSAV